MSMTAQTIDSEPQLDNLPKASSSLADSTTRLLDLEKELTCSICTDILYQPLTLLDCLHTFCGSCLKEWFHWQRTSVSERQSNVSMPITGMTSPFTCPSCRSMVREARPNAAVTTLLDMFIEANPSRVKTSQEKAEIAKNYNPGDITFVLDPSQGEAGKSVRVYGNSLESHLDEAEQDRRLLQEVQDMSLREYEESTSRIREARAQRREIHRRQLPSEHGVSRRHRLTDQHEVELRRSNNHERRRVQHRDEHAQTRATSSLNHQQSLRSMISISDMNSTEMEEEIFRQIVDEGLLDDIDLSNIDTCTEDLISERIAQAYRRRRRHRQRHRDNAERSTEPRRDESFQARQMQALTQIVGREPALEQSDRGIRNLPRSASLAPSDDPAPIQEQVPPSRNILRTMSISRIRSDVSSPRFRSAQSMADLSVSPGFKHRDEAGRREQRVDDIPLIDEWSSVVTESRNTDTRSSTSEQHQQRARKPRPLGLQEEFELASVNESLNEDGSQDSLSTSLTSAALSNDQLVVHHELAQKSNTQTLTRLTFTAPIISCRSCLERDIAYALHYNCNVCASLLNEDYYALCLRCYRLSKGCLHWFGFGRRAMINFQRYSPNPDYVDEKEPPHRMLGQRFSKKTDLTHSLSDRSDRSRCSDRIVLEEGLFCDFCKCYANDCYWKCETCNEGEWGFCNSCVNTSHHCTHPLTAYGWNEEPQPSFKRSSDGLLTSVTSLHGQSGRASVQASKGHLYAITTQTTCNVCGKSIHIGEQYFHCPVCNHSDYDICMPCCERCRFSEHSGQAYDGAVGWQRCEQGHRMSAIMFELGPLSQSGSVDKLGLMQRRIVMEGTIGDFNDNEQDISLDATTTRFEQGPLRQFSQKRNDARFQAFWTRIPDKGVMDELTFPRGAVIIEVKEMNQDWYWGVYCGQEGLFPGAFGRII